MSVEAEPVHPGAHPSFRHEAFLYATDDEFVGVVAPFIRDGVGSGASILVLLDAPKISWLRDALGGDADADAVKFTDLADLGTNPARLIPTLRDFVDGAGGAVRGVGEPIWPGRPAAELSESQRHESLINLAFADARDLQVMCPYDVNALDASVIEEALHTHPFAIEHGAAHRSREFLGIEAVPTRFDQPLPPPTSTPDTLEFDAGSLDSLRRFVGGHARAAGLDRIRMEDLVLAVNELASNSVQHGGGHGVLRIWTDDDALFCEVHDGGRIDDPMAGRKTPPATKEGGRGLWIVNQLCDLVQIRSADGNVVRLTMYRIPR